MKYTSNEIQSAGAEVPVDEVVAEALPAGLAGSAMAYTPLRVHFLARLQRLSDARHEIGMTNDEDPFMKRLVDRGLFATYRECIDEGVTTEVRHILKI
jgi:hypothetical protein